MAVTGGAIVNLICNGLLIPQLGSVGATLGTLMAELSVLTISAHCAKKEIHFFRMFSRYSYYLLFGMTMFIAVRFFDLRLDIEQPIIRLLLMIMIGGGVYSILCMTVWLKVKEKSVFGGILNSLSKKGEIRK